MPRTLTETWILRTPLGRRQRFTSKQEAMSSARYQAKTLGCTITLVYRREEIIGTFNPGEELLVPPDPSPSADCDHEP